MSDSRTTAAELLEMIRGGRLGAVELAERLFIKRDNARSLNAFIADDRELQLDQARAFDNGDNGADRSLPLAGLPVVVKDNINTADLPTTGGTPSLRDHRPGRDAPVVARLRAQGALVAGKTNLHELAFGITSNNAAFGPVRNPYDPAMIPGGSSGGTAAAIAAGLAPLGLGTDTGGSCRIPAALCGVVGLRPTLGRYPCSGVIPLSSTRDTPGPLGLTVEDVALLDGAITGESTHVDACDLSKVRLGVPRGYFYDDLDPNVAAVVEQALEQLSGAGAELVEVDLPDVAALNAAVSFPVVLYESVRLIPEYLSEFKAGVSFRELVDQVASPDVKGVLESQLGDDAMPEAVYREAMDQHRPALRAAYQRYFADHGLDAMAFPTTPLPARPIGEDETVELNDTRVPTFPTYIRNTDPASNAGLPGLTVPAGQTAAGLPVGIEFDGPEGSDRRLLAIGRAFAGLAGRLPEPKV